MTVKEVSTSRRGILKMGLGLGGAALAAGTAGKVIAAACGRTPPQTEGPFYPVDHQLDEDTDLTLVKGRSQRATGQAIYVLGTVTDETCQPVAGAVVEIWQACASGKYNHPGDQENPAPLDPNFQYYGTALTDAQGKYIFKTIQPGSYPAAPGWIRPSHIHFKVHKRGYLELTTQMYFEGDRYNGGDKILQRLSRADQNKVIVKLVAPIPDMDPLAKMGTFDIALQRV